MRCSSTVSATPACLPPALTACPRSRRVTPELLMGETGLERLAKISRDGIQSLSPTEKRFLKRASERR